MIVKMKFINISGPRQDIDRVTDQYLSKYEIQLESALSELKTVDNLRPFVETNPYRDALAQAEQFAGYVEHPDQVTPDGRLALNEMFELIRNVSEEYQGLQDKKGRLQGTIDDMRGRQQVIAPFRPLDFDLQDVLGFKFIAYRFGKLPLEYYHRIPKYLEDNLNAIFVEGEHDDSFVYGAYFVSPGESTRIDTVFRSLHFERISFDGEYHGTPTEAYLKLEREVGKTAARMEELEEEVAALINRHAPQLIATRNRLEELANNFDVRKMAARMGDSQEDSYILCGWMAEDDIAKFQEESKDDDNIFIMVEEDRESYFGTPPTKLKNPKLFKPFEMYVQMYGLPAHDEMDPTMLVGLTYSFIFGAMFGDVGHGLLLFLGGGLLYLKKKIPLAGIISCAGVFSTIFGFLFGSLFGFEDILQPLWLRPIEHMTTLPFIGKLNTVFVVSVAFGMGVILFAMVLHIVTAAKNRDVGATWFDSNGVAGLVFYGAIVATIVLFMTGHKVPAAGLLLVMFVLPLILILLKEPLTRMITKSSEKMEEGVVMFLVQGIFELVEVLLSYFSNTISFVRIGAFAISHAAMMEVVLQLSGAESGSPNWVVVVFGNIFVCAFEGLIVGIQVLRLEYYELFSRFYQGSGRAFTPYKNKNGQKKKAASKR